MIQVLSTGDELKDHKMVLQCQTCRTIVGDSNELMCVFSMDEDNDDDSGDREPIGSEYISLACASNVRLEPCDSGTPSQKERKKKKRHKTDVSPEYVIIVCDTCSSHVGRMYNTTRSSDKVVSEVITNMFSFRLDAIERYYFGSGELRVIPPSQQQDDEKEEQRHHHECDERNDDTINRSLSDVERMRLDLDRVTRTVAKMEEELSVHRKKIAQYDALLSHSIS